MGICSCGPPGRGVAGEVFHRLRDARGGIALTVVTFCGTLRGREAGRRILEEMGFGCEGAKKDTQPRIQSDPELWHGGWAAKRKCAARVVY